MIVELGDAIADPELCPKCLHAAVMTYPVVMLTSGGAAKLGESTVCLLCWAEENPEAMADEVARHE